jgi:hypothetical protein
VPTRAPRHSPCRSPGRSQPWPSTRRSWRKVRAVALCGALPPPASLTPPCTGLEALLAPLVADSDAQVEAVLASQQNLSASLDRLVSELDKVAATAPDSASAHPLKLAALRSRVGALSSALHAIQERLNRLNAGVGRLPASTLADLARQELHAPPPPSPQDLASRAGPLTASLLEPDGPLAHKAAAT